MLVKIEVYTTIRFKAILLFLRVNSKLLVLFYFHHSLSSDIGKNLLNIVVVFNFIEHFLDIYQLLLGKLYRRGGNAL